MFETFSKNRDEYEKKLEVLDAQVHTYARDFDPEAIHHWCESDPDLNESYTKFLNASEEYADCVCLLGELMKEGKDANEVVRKQLEAHNSSEKWLKSFVESAHKKGHLQDFSIENIPRPKSAQLALYSAFTNAHEQIKRMMGEIKKAG